MNFVGGDKEFDVKELCYVQPAISIQLAVVHSTANKGRNYIVLQKMYSFCACAILIIAHA